MIALHDAVGAHAGMRVPATTGSAVRVLIVDAQLSVRIGLRALFEARPEFELYETADPDEALKAARLLSPALVVMDLSLGARDGRGLLAMLAAGDDAPRVLVLTMLDESSWGAVVRSAGAHGFVSKDATPSVILDAVDALLADREWFDGAASACGVQHDAERLERLTPREREILLGVASGLGSKRLALQLGVSAATVDSHRRNIRVKLGCETASQWHAWSELLLARSRPTGD
jgi:DNA-binding NarL/FixJ family response regulator